MTTYIPHVNSQFSLNVNLTEVTWTTDQQLCMRDSVSKPAKYSLRETTEDVISEQKARQCNVSSFVTDVSFLECWRVVDSVTSDCDYEALTLETFNNHQLLLR